MFNFIECRVMDITKTFKPHRKHKDGTVIYNTHKLALSLLDIENLKESVKLPLVLLREVDGLNHWLAAHTVDFYNLINIIYGSLTQYCTEETCPSMNGGTKLEYLWKAPPPLLPQQGNALTKAKAKRVSAPLYIHLLLTWVETQLNNEQIFPHNQIQDQPVSNLYPPNFKSIVSSVFKRLIRVFVHIYYAHYTTICTLNEECHINTAFKHYMLFIAEYDLLHHEDLLPVETLVRNILDTETIEKLFSSKHKHLHSY